MKLMFVSDIHGSLFWAKKVIEVFLQEDADYLVFLGDLLYHGPRNPLPQEYNPKEVAQLFNTIKDKVIAVRGNCDSEVDQMMLEFPMMGDYNIIPLKSRKVLVSHGHLYHEKNLPASLVNGDLFVYGHIHLPVLKQENGIYLINPGSVSLPKEENPHSYGLLCENKFTIKTFEGDVLKQLAIQ